jgi:glycosyltransferase involved in cell wall biosynthesis
VAAARRPGFTFQTFQQTGKGKADAVRLGFSHASGDALMILDADLSVQPEDLRHFYDAFTRHSAEFLNGSRLVYDMEKQAMQLMNLFFNKVFGILISWLIGQPVKDTLCGTKVIYRQDYERIRKNFLALGQMDPFGDFELLFGASRLNLKICDVPVRYKERVYGTTNIRRWRHGWELLKMLLAGWKEMK